jgi:NAD(P)-dependent dehydrogenase (short-subunit alcohol dehydrogenase family)
MRIELSGKLALVTGSTGGIGKAIANGLAATGADVIVNGRRQQSVDTAIQDIKASVAGARVRGVAADVSSAEGCSVLVKAVPAVDILVNNAGVFEPKSFFDIPDEDWLRLFQINVMAGVRLSRAYMPAMLSRNWGRILFISSESALNMPNEMIHYGSTKAAELAIARGLAQLTAGTAVTVNSVLPGPTRSDGVEAFLAKMAERLGKPVHEMAADFIKKYRPTSLLRRFASVEEIANMECTRHRRRRRLRMEPP